MSSKIDFNNGFIVGMTTHGLIKNQNFIKAPVKSLEWVRPTDWLSYPTFNTIYDEIYLLGKVLPGTSSTFSFYIIKTLNTNWAECYVNGVTYNMSESSYNRSSFSFSVNYNDLPEQNYCTRGYKSVWIRFRMLRSKLKGFDCAESVSRVNLKLVKTTSNILEYYGNCSSIGLGISYVDRYPTTSYGFSAMEDLECVTHIGEISNFFSSSTGFKLFAKCKKLQKVNSDLIFKPEVVNISGMFMNCVSLKTIALNNTGTITDMNSLFSGCTSLSKVDIDSSNLQYAKSMFEKCFHLKNTAIDLSFYTEKIIDASRMFYDCYSLEKIYLLLPSATKIDSLAYRCYSLEEISLLYLGLVTSMDWAFYWCRKIKNNKLNLNRLYSIKSIKGSFYGCASLDSIPSQLNFNTIEYFDYAFEKCINIQERSFAANLDLSFNAAISFYDPFSSCNNYLMDVQEIHLNFTNNLTKFAFLGRGINWSNIEIYQVVGLQNVNDDEYYFSGNEYSISYTLSLMTSLKSIILDGFKGQEGNTILKFANGNLLDSNALDVFFNSLGTCSYPEDCKIDISTCPGAQTCDKTIAENKGWIFI